MKPYLDTLKRCTGYDGGLPDGYELNFEPLVRNRSGVLLTWLADKQKIAATIYATVRFVNDDEKQNAREKQAKHHDWSVKLWLGTTHRIEQYLKDEHGRTRTDSWGNPKANPRYHELNGKPYPCLGDRDVWHGIFRWWMANHATAEQLDILERERLLNEASGLDVAWHASSGIGPYNIDSGLYYENPGGTVNWSKDKEVSFMKWVEFAALSKKEVKS